MILKEDIHLKNLCGIHKLQGFERSKRKSVGPFGIEEWRETIKFMLDGITFEAIEDPDDGYRSYCDNIIISDEKPKYTFPDYEVLCKMKPDTNEDEHEVLMGVDPCTGLVIFEIGTLYINDYYPCCHFEYHPENMHF